MSMKMTFSVRNINQMQKYFSSEMLLQSFMGVIVQLPHALLLLSKPSSLVKLYPLVRGDNVSPTFIPLLDTIPYLTFSNEELVSI